MKVFLLHGMGGGPADWAAVRRDFSGEALEFSPAPDFSGVVSALVEKLGRESTPYGLAGYSLGGRVALAATARLVELHRAPARLALLGAGLGFPSSAEREARRARDEAWGALVQNDPARFWREWYEQELFSTFRALPHAEREAWLRSRAELAPSLIARQLVSWSPTRHAYLLPALRSVLAAGVCTLYLSGERDKKYASLARELAREGVRAELLPGAGHILPLEAPAALAHALQSFFNEESSDG